MVESLAYRLVLPPGWVRIPVGDGAEAAIELLAQQAGQRSGNLDVRAIIHAGLRDAVAGARKSDGLHLYLPTEPIHGVPVPLSIIVSTPRPQSGTLADALLSFSARSPSTAIQLGGHLGVRQATDAEAVFDAQGQMLTPASRRITYVVVPPRGERLFAITGSIIRFDVPDGALVLSTVEQLFDAMSATLRFDSTSRLTA